MNILITFSWTNFEDQRENKSEFNELRTTSDVDEANSMVRLKKDGREAMTFNPFTSMGNSVCTGNYSTSFVVLFWFEIIMAVEIVEIRRVHSSVGDIIAALI
jgi:hypothetical protein